MKMAGYKFNLDLIEFKENDVFIVYSPALDIAGYGNTKKEAGDSLKETITTFLEYAHNNNTLDEELERLGWEKSINNSRSRFIPPSLSSLMQHNTILQEIVNHQEFYKKVKQVSFA